MKHDYMTDRNWKLDELIENSSPAARGSFKVIVVWLIAFVIILIAAGFAWQYVKKQKAEEAQMQAASSQTEAAAPASTTASASPTSSSSPTS